MTTQEFSDAFDTLLNSYNSKFPNSEQPAIALDEYEKSVFLTLAQKEIVINLYNGKNPYGDTFEVNEELRRSLDGLVKTRLYEEEDREDSIIEKLHSNSIFFKLPSDIAFITYEQVTYQDESLKCYNGSTADVCPITQDEYNRVIRNPFRGPTRYKVLRVDTGDNTVELISLYNIGRYIIKYLSDPPPIVLEDLPEGLNINEESSRTECVLNKVLHEPILRRAVQMAIASKSIDNRNSKGES